MLFQISSDRLYLLYPCETGGTEKILLPYGSLEHHIADLFYTHTGLFLAHPHVTVLNGPGSFTHLRIATLALNTYQALHAFPLQVTSVTKLQRYSALYAASRIPRYGIIYIGQKKNFWFVDFASPHACDNIHHLVHEADLASLLALYAVEDIFFDEMMGEGKDALCTIYPHIQRYEATLDDAAFVTNRLGLPSQALIDPEYMIPVSVG